MCKLCDLKYESSYDSYAMGEEVGDFRISKDLDCNPDEVEASFSLEVCAFYSMTIHFCPLCGKDCMDFVVEKTRFG